MSSLTQWLGWLVSRVSRNGSDRASPDEAYKGLYYLQAQQPPYCQFEVDLTQTAPLRMGASGADFAGPIPLKLSSPLYRSWGASTMLRDIRVALISTPSQLVRGENSVMFSRFCGNI